MAYGYIYKITNLINAKVYVGQTTKTVEQRFKGHCNSKKSHIGLAIKKYGKINFKIELLAIADNQKQLNALEVVYVNNENCLHPNGYNHRAGGDQQGIVSDSTKSKISKSKLGKPNLKRRGELRSTEYRIKISKGLGGKRIKATHLDTGEIKIYETAHSTRSDGHNPSNVVQICKKSTHRTHSKRWAFEYLKS